MVKRFLAAGALLTAFFSASLALTLSTAVAQEDPSYALQIMTRQCAESPCNEDEATPIDDVTVMISSEDGTIDYGSCTTSIEGKPDGCSVMVDPGTTVAVTVDADTIPAGYALLDYPVMYDVPAEKTEVGDVWLYFTPRVDTVPDNQDTDAEAAATQDASGSDDVIAATAPPQLPSTGAGVPAGSPDISVIILGGLAGASLLLLGGAFALHRRTAGR